MTINEALDRAATCLSSIESPTLEVRLLLAHLLNKPQAWLFSNQNNKIDSQIASKFFTLVKKRQNHLPLAYLTHHKEFFGLDFYIDERVFIPRSETENLVEKALSTIKASSFKHKASPDDYLVADIGTGSGCIAIAITNYLLHNPPPNLNWKMFATDICPQALEVAQLNARKLLGSPPPITLLQGDLLKPLPHRVDLIVTNLPYLSENEYQNTQPEVKREPKSALVGGTQGNELINKLLQQAPEYLKPDGQVIYESTGGQIFVWAPNESIR